MKTNFPESGGAGERLDVRVPGSVGPVEEVEVRRREEGVEAEREGREWSWRCGGRAFAAVSADGGRQCWRRRRGSGRRLRC